jgi:integrase
VVGNRKSFNDRTIKALKAPAQGEAEYWDSSFPGLGIRVSDHGRKTFFLAARFPGTKGGRRKLGVYGPISLADARKKASRWLELIAAGKDPAIEEERERRAELRRQENSFEKVAEGFIAEKLGSERRGAATARDIRRVFIPAWGNRPISDIDPLDVRNLIAEFKDRPFQAHNLLGYARRIFSWAYDQHCYGLEASPVDRIKAKSLLGAKKSRKRVLTDAELRAFWKAADAIGYPYGPLFQLLLLTGARKSEIALARWSEIDRARRVLIVPVEKHKSERGHIIWFSDPAWQIIESLPVFNGGDCLFSTRNGRAPINSFSRGKDALDEVMARELGAEPPPWVIHDLRRSMRSRLATLSISQAVAELMIGHAQGGLVETYSPEELLMSPDYADLFAKLQDGWRQWAQRLRNILEPSPANVLELARA